MKAPFYRLRELIDEKFGEEKFATGCALVAWWLHYETKSKFSQAWVEQACEIAAATNKTYRLTYKSAKALKELFKLSDYKALYRLPATAPDFPNINIQHNE